MDMTNEKMLAKEFFAQKWIDLEKRAKEGEINKRRREKQKQYEQQCMSQPIDTIKLLIVKFEKLKIET
jgi:hypothetical protein